MLAADEPAAPQPQATAVGQETCATCHEQLTTQFQQNPHGRLASFEERGMHGGCESCHGPASLHVEGGGDVTLIRTFRKSGDATEMNRQCLSCHSAESARDWNHSDHALTGLACTDCHRIHQSRRIFTTAAAEQPGLRPLHADAPPPRGSLTRPEPQLCLECHKEKTGQMMMTSRHPVREGKMKCSSCHQAHGSSVRQLKTEEQVNDLCLSCHTEKQGPFVFEHAPVNENCMTCHEPHGTVANSLLRQNEPFLCLQCHEGHFHLGRSGISAPAATSVFSSTNPYGEKGWRTAFGTKCTQCHSQVHGSDLPSQSVPGQGRALTR